MALKYVACAVFAASLITLPAEQAEADAGDFIAGALIGGIVGANVKKQRRSTTRQRTTRRSSIPITQEGKQIQYSLNYFGFDAGRVDGQLGRKTRDAVSQYQAYLGYPITGQLSPFEYNLLVSSYNQAQAGGQNTIVLAANNPEGTRGLLKAYRAEMAGQGTTTTVAVAPVAVAPAPVPVAALTAEPAAPSLTAALPAFLGAGTQASLTSHCNQVSLVTNTNGGFTTLANMTDPNAALNEQFCLARTYAIARSEELASKVPGFTPDQIAAQCEGFGPAMKDRVASLGLKPRDTVVAETAQFIQGTGMAAAQLAGTARICMGVGYRKDNMDVAVGSALLLYTLGEPVYGELMGHHLSQGFGPAKRIDLAGAWYENGLNALDNGAQAVFNPGQPERKELLRQASQRLNGGAGLSVLPQPVPASTVPNFSIIE
ncbi:hypothetical protein C1J03_15840 [Sulfitobacter sp. SK012]|uniref:peptidoglycan-binding domain-containing protein n=1 Tax=Sulfitobacter sp. SK012 TaxID=1389005 RepID=UPI000E0B18FD|nr:peptidoglycan-binding domain-containing protein [Sulfitobacter sp. SK012]AXI47349.1 hypothetical protein C1J03_15840 [Sulfitobacter sp. SK012]